MAGPALTDDDLREMFRLMLMGRRFTERAVELALADEIPTGLHPSAGQEAVGVGACYGPALRRLGGAVSQDDRGLLDAGRHPAPDDERHYG